MTQKPVRTVFRIQVGNKWILCLVAGFVAVLLFWPLFFGRIPLPAEVVTNFPLWDSWRPGATVHLRHAEMGDLVVFEYPVRKLVHEFLRSGRLPLWNPGAFAGVPLAADSASAVFYPPFLLGTLLPLKSLWAVAFPFRMIVAFLLAALLSRRLGASTGGAVVSGAVFSLSGFLVSWQGWCHSDSAIYLPLCFLAVEAIRTRPTLLRIVLAALAFPLPILAGHAEIAVYVLAATAAWAVFRLVSPMPEDTAPRARSRYLLALSAAGLLALGLAAVHVVPFLEWVPELARQTDRANWGGIPLRESVMFLSRDATMSPSTVGVSVPEHSGYAGLLPLMLAPLALTGNRRRETLFFVVLLLVAFLIAFGLPPALTVFHAIPVIRSLHPFRFLLLVDFAIAILAGLGLTALQRTPDQPVRRTARRLALLAPALLLIAATVILIFRFAGNPSALAGSCGLVSSLVFAVLSAGWLAWALLRPPGRERALGIGASLIVLADLIPFAYGNVPFFPPEAVFPEPALFRFLRETDSSVHRIAVVDGTAPPGAEAAFGFEAPTGSFYVLRRTSEFLSPLAGKPRRFPLIFSLRSERIISSNNRTLDLMNVKYLVTNSYNESAERLLSRPDRFRLIRKDGTASVFENVRSLPRAFLVPSEGIEVIPDDRAALERIEQPGFDPAVRAVVDVSPAWPEGEASAPGQMRVTRIQSEFGETSVDAELESNALLVVSETYYPGWTALVDGRPVPLLRADYIFRGVPLGPGTHTVRFRYAPASFRLGAALTGISAAALLVMAGLAFRVRRTPKRALGL